MLAFDLKDRAGRPLVRVAVFPMPSVVALAHGLYETFRYLAQASGERFFILVTSDVTSGWRLDTDAPQAPSLKIGTPALLAPYAGTTLEVQLAKESYLAELAQAWLADLATGWKGGGPVPGETELTRMGLLPELRADAFVGTSPS